jgi:hypothetical protein
LCLLGPPPCSRSLLGRAHPSPFGLCRQNVPDLFHPLHCPHVAGRHAKQAYSQTQAVLIWVSRREWLRCATHRANAWHGRFRSCHVRPVACVTSRDDRHLRLRRAGSPGLGKAPPIVSVGVHDEDGLDADEIPHSSSMRHQDHPGHAEAIGSHAETGGKEGLGHGHLHLTLVGQRREQPFGFGVVPCAEG